MAARWPPLIVGLKIESVHELGCLSSAQAKRIVSKINFMWPAQPSWA